VQVPPLTTPLLIEQLIPAGALVTVPVPVPKPPEGTEGAMVTGKVPGPLLNVAVTVVLADTVTTHVFAVPLQPPPLHPPNTDPGFGVSPNVIWVPLATVSKHVPAVVPLSSEQLIAPPETDP
jgi:hypothetical protein